MRILLALSLFFQISYAQLLSTSGSQIVDDNNQEILLRGVGLGGWMLQEGYMMNSVGGADTQYEFKNNLTELIGAEETEIFYDNWLANFVTETDIEQLSNLGYNSVRLAMHYNLFTPPIEQEPVLGENTWLEKGFEIGHAIQKQGLDMIVVRKKDIPKGMNRQLAGRLNGLVLLVSESNVVLTAYKNSKTASRDLKKKDKRNMKKSQLKAA